MKRQLACLLTGISLSWGAFYAGAGEPARLPILPEDDAEVILLPLPVVSAAAHVASTAAETQAAAQLTTPPVSSTQPQFVAIPSAPLDGGYCPPFYRDRPKGCKKMKLTTMANNRASEPGWYRYYRCNHFGFHPTHWMAWPEGWMSCRNPMPGPHPYDLKPPESNVEDLMPSPERDRDREPVDRARDPNNRNSRQPGEAPPGDLNLPRPKL